MKFSGVHGDEWAHVYDPISQAPKIRIPVLVFSTDGALIPEQAKKFYDSVKSEKQLVWGRGYHFNFYDVFPEMMQAVDALRARFLLVRETVCSAKCFRMNGTTARRACDRAIPNQVPGMVGEGVETGWRASLGDEGTVRLSSKGESDRITQRSAVQIRPPQP
jgi:hypothetical protein